jgi:hypothetical protein
MNLQSLRPERPLTCCAFLSAQSNAGAQGELPTMSPSKKWVRFRRADVLAMLEPEPRLNFGAAQPR